MRKLALVFCFLGLVILYFVCFSAVAAIVLPGAPTDTSNHQNATLFQALLLICLLNSAVLAYVILRSRWAGWKLSLTICFVLFGVTTVMPQIETAVFIRDFPPGLLARLFVFGLIFSAVFAPLAVLTLGKRRSSETTDEYEPRLQMSNSQWAIKLLLIAIIYTTIYFTFGYFVAWKNPAVRAYYGGRDPGSFLDQMISVIRETPWLIPLQFLRAMLWTALAVPVIRMMKGHWWEAGLAVALLFGVVMNTQLLLPNPLMPQEVRMTHLLETAPSNFLFGWILVWVLRARQSLPVPRTAQA
jgi:hypothetical protein